MKPWILCLVLTSGGIQILLAMDAPFASGPTAYAIKERGSYYRAWQKVTSATNDLGVIVAQTNSTYVELATGMHHLRNGEWIESSDQIDILPEGGAAATTDTCII